MAGRARVMGLPRLGSGAQLARIDHQKGWRQLKAKKPNNLGPTGTKDIRPTCQFEAVFTAPPSCY